MIIIFTSNLDSMPFHQTKSNSFLLRCCQEKKEQGLAELHSVVASIDEKTQPLQDQLAGFTDFRRKYPDAVMTGTAMALALPSLLRRSLFRSVLWAGSGYFLSSVTLEWLRIQDGKKK